MTTDMNKKTVTDIDLNGMGIVGITAIAVGLMLASKGYMASISAASSPSQFALGITLSSAMVGASLLVAKAAKDEMVTTRTISTNDPKYDNYAPAREHVGKGMSVLGKAISKAFTPKTREQRMEKRRQKADHAKTMHGHNKSSWNK